MRQAKTKRSYHRLSEYQKGKIHTLRAQGMTLMQIAEKVGVQDYSTIGKYLKKAEDPAKCDKKIGRPIKITKSIRKAVVDMTLTDRNLTLPENQAKLSPKKEDSSNSEQPQIEVPIPDDLNPSILPSNSRKAIFFHPGEKKVYSEETTEIPLSRESIRPIRINE